ncbi:MAG: hypothetical protein IPK32_14745 [Verrucomicrobiaceae bacterium]|nr:hypothetical protein [Verrucomicrobiaceae bacterium]
MNPASPASTSVPATAPLGQAVPWWFWLHVLSLEAPLVAVLWQMSLARQHGLALMPSLYQGLALAVWTVYLVDRTMDTSKAAFDVRHAFYQRFRSEITVMVLPLCVAGLVWLAFWRVPEDVMWQAVSIAVVTLFYFLIFIVRIAPPLVPKPHAAGLIFALGCTSSIRFFGMPETVAEPLLECVVIAFLFITNLTGIAAKNEEMTQAGTRRWRVLHPALLGCHVIILAALLVLIHLERCPAGLAATITTALCGLALLAVLHRYRAALSPAAYRVLADLAVIVPLPLLWLVG